MDLAVERIQLNPEAGPPLSAKVRRRLLEKFPYSIIYTLPPDRNPRDRRDAYKPTPRLLERETLERRKFTYCRNRLASFAAIKRSARSAIPGGSHRRAAPEEGPVEAAPAEGPAAAAEPVNRELSYSASHPESIR